MKVERMSADDVKPCAVCGNPATHVGFFYVVRIEQGMIDFHAAQRQAGLEMMVGSADVAAALGDRRVLKVWPYGSGEVQVCNECLTSQPRRTSMVHLMGAMETAEKAEEEGEDGE